MSGPERTWRVRHRTAYGYDRPVTMSHAVAHVRPRELPWQRCTAFALDVDPAPHDVAEGVDAAGNTRTYLQVVEPHTALVVATDATVEVGPPRHDPDALRRPWEECRPVGSAAVDAWAARGLVLPSPRVPAHAGATGLAAASLRPGRPVGEALADLCSQVHDRFAYDPRATTVTSSVSDLLERGAGVCQDFAHLVVAGLRGHGLAARYVSGYLATTPPPGRERVFGADATHAWVACWVPGAGWVALDPTNDAWVDERYVTVAWGRDYGDVPPLRGIIVSDARSHTLDVSVDVAPVDADTSS